MFYVLCFALFICVCAFHLRLCFSFAFALFICVCAFHLRLRFSFAFVPYALRLTSYILHLAHCVLCFVFAPCALYSAFRITHYAFRILHFAFRILHFAFLILPPRPVRNTPAISKKVKDFFWKRHTVSKYAGGASRLAIEFWLPALPIINHIFLPTLLFREKPCGFSRKRRGCETVDWFPMQSEIGKSEACSDKVLLFCDKS